MILMFTFGNYTMGVLEMDHYIFEEGGVGQLPKKSLDEKILAKGAVRK